MKQAILCPICNKYKRFSESYAVNITTYKGFTSEMDDTGILTFSNSAKVRVCRLCIKKMGYKVKKGITKLPLDNRLTKEL